MQSLSTSGSVFYEISIGLIIQILDFSHKIRYNYINETQNKSGEIRGITVHIRQTAQGKRKTAYKYKWKFDN